MARLQICHNLGPIGENKFAGGATTKGSNTSMAFLAQTSPPSQALALAPTFTLGPLSIYTNINLQRTIRLTLKLFVKGEEHEQANSAPGKRAFKACNPDLYYRSLNIEYYYFFQQYKNHFNIVGVTVHQCVSFVTLFL